MTATIVGSETGIVVKPAAASKFVVSAPVHRDARRGLYPDADRGGRLRQHGHRLRGTVHFSSSDNTAALPANYTFTATDGGQHTFTNKMTLKKKGKQTFTVTDTMQQRPDCHHQHHRDVRRRTPLLKNNTDNKRPASCRRQAKHSITAEVVQHRGAT